MTLAIAMDFLAQAATEKPAPWYQAVSGILGIPATILAMVGSWYLVKKTSLESRKLDLELKEKENALRVAEQTGSPAEVARIVAEPVLSGKRVQDVLIRFVLLYLVLQVWNV